MKSNRRYQYALSLALTLNALVSIAAWSAPADFLAGINAPGAIAQLFGGAAGPGAIGQDPDDTPNKGSDKPVKSAPPPPSSAGGPTFPTADNTADEKRMQKKYKANLNHMKDLIAKGEAMMKTAPNKDDKAYKKGKILKELGEKHLADMQANSPYQLELLESEKKKEKEKASK